MELVCQLVESIRNLHVVLRVRAALVHGIGARGVFIDLRGSIVQW